MKSLEDLNVLSPEEQVARTLARDAWRVRWLTRLTMLSLVLMALFCGIFWYIGREVYFHAYNAEVAYSNNLEKAEVHNLKDMSDEQRTIRSLSETNKVIGIVLMAAPFMGLGIALAAIATVQLVRTTQRATMRQIHASLADIATQLDVLNQSKVSDGP